MHEHSGVPPRLLPMTTTIVSVAAKFERPQALSGQLSSALCDRSSYVDTAVTWEEFERSLGRTMRRNVEYYARRLSKNFSCEFRLPESSNDIELAIDHLVRLHQMRWQVTDQPGTFAEPHVESFLRTATRQSQAEWRLRLWTLTVNGRRGRPRRVSGSKPPALLPEGPQSRVRQGGPRHGRAVAQHPRLFRRPSEQPCRTWCTFFWSMPHPRHRACRPARGAACRTYATQISHATTVPRVRRTGSCGVSPERPKGPTLPGSRQISSRGEIYRGPGARVGSRRQPIKVGEHCVRRSLRCHGKNHR